MKTPSKDIKDLALLVSLIGLGWSGSAAAQTAPEAVVASTNDQPQRSDWDWVPPDAVAASRAELARLTALPRESMPEPEPVELSQPGPVAPSNAEVVAGLPKSDWDWSPADGGGFVVATAAATATEAVDDEQRDAHTERLPSLAATAPKRFVVAEHHGRVLVTRIPVEDHAPAELARELPSPPVAATVAMAEARVVADDPRPSGPSEGSAVPRLPELSEAPAVSHLSGLPEAPAVSHLSGLPEAPAVAPFRAIEASRHAAVPVESPTHVLADASGPALNARTAVIAHTEKVLLSLASVRAIDLTLMSGLPAIEATHPAAVPVESPIRVLADAPRPDVPARIAVVTHSEKVLLSLASVRAVDSTPMELMALLPQDIAVSKVPGAATPEVPARPPGEGWVAVDSHQLDKVRGGFSTPQLQVSFGISRAVYINGSLVTTTSLNLSDVGKPSGGLPAAANLPGSLALVQSGTGNSFLSMPTANGTVATVIQNTLNNQKIQTLTQINATVNSLQILKGMNLQQTLRSGVIDSLRH